MSHNRYSYDSRRSRDTGSSRHSSQDHRSHNSYSHYRHSQSRSSHSNVPPVNKVRESDPVSRLQELIDKHKKYTKNEEYLREQKSSSSVFLSSDIDFFKKILALREKEEFDADIVAQFLKILTAKQATWTDLENTSIEVDTVNLSLSHWIFYLLRSRILLKKATFDNLKEIISTPARIRGWPSSLKDYLSGKDWRELALNILNAINLAAQEHIRHRKYRLYDFTSYLLSLMVEMKTHFNCGEAEFKESSLLIILSKSIFNYYQGRNDHRERQENEINSIEMLMNYIKLLIEYSKLDLQQTARNNFGYTSLRDKIISCDWVSRFGRINPPLFANMISLMNQLIEINLFDDKFREKTELCSNIFSILIVHFKRQEGYLNIEWVIKILKVLNAIDIASSAYAVTYDHVFSLINLLNKYGVTWKHLEENQLDESFRTILDKISQPDKSTELQMEALEPLLSKLGLQAAESSQALEEKSLTVSAVTVLVLPELPPVSENVFRELTENTASPIIKKSEEVEDKEPSLASKEKKQRKKRKNKASDDERTDSDVAVDESKDEEQNKSKGKKKFTKKRVKKEETNAEEEIQPSKNNKIGKLRKRKRTEVKEFIRRSTRPQKKAVIYRDLDIISDSKEKIKAKKKKSAAELDLNEEIDSHDKILRHFKYFEQHENDEVEAKLTKDGISSYCWNLLHACSEQDYWLSDFEKPDNSLILKMVTLAASFEPELDLQNLSDDNKKILCDLNNWRSLIYNHIFVSEPEGSADLSMYAKARLQSYLDYLLYESELTAENEEGLLLDLAKYTSEYFHYFSSELSEAQLEHQEMDVKLPEFFQVICKEFKDKQDVIDEMRQLINNILARWSKFPRYQHSHGVSLETLAKKLADKTATLKDDASEEKQSHEESSSVEQNSSPIASSSSSSSEIQEEKTTLESHKEKAQQLGESQEPDEEKVPSVTTENKAENSNSSQDEKISTSMQVTMQEDQPEDVLADVPPAEKGAIETEIKSTDNEADLSSNQTNTVVPAITQITEAEDKAEDVLADINSDKTNSSSTLHVIAPAVVPADSQPDLSITQSTVSVENSHSDSSSSHSSSSTALIMTLVSVSPTVSQSGINDEKISGSVAMPSRVSSVAADGMKNDVVVQKVQVAAVPKPVTQKPTRLPIKFPPAKTVDPQFAIKEKIKSTEADFIEKHSSDVSKHEERLKLFEDYLSLGRDKANIISTYFENAFEKFSLIPADENDERYMAVLKKYLKLRQLFVENDLTFFTVQEKKLQFFEKYFCLKDMKTNEDLNKYFDSVLEKLSSVDLSMHHDNYLSLLKRYLSLCSARSLYNFKIDEEFTEEDLAYDAEIVFRLNAKITGINFSNIMHSCYQQLALYNRKCGRDNLQRAQRELLRACEGNPGELKLFEQDLIKRQDETLHYKKMRWQEWKRGSIAKKWGAYYFLVPEESATHSQYIKYLPIPSPLSAGVRSEFIEVGVLLDDKKKWRLVKLKPQYGTEPLALKNAIDKSIYAHTLWSNSSSAPHSVNTGKDSKEQSKDALNNSRLFI